MGASLLRSYEEEQRLVQENATLRSQLEALRRQCENEAEWRRDARSLQVPGYACACACVRVRARTHKCTRTGVHPAMQSVRVVATAAAHEKAERRIHENTHIRPNSPNETRPWWQRSKGTWTAWDTCASNSKTFLPTWLLPRPRKLVWHNKWRGEKVFLVSCITPTDSRARARALKQKRRVPAWCALCV
jgi:hypothetical protein